MYTHTKILYSAVCSSLSVGYGAIEMSNLSISIIECKNGLEDE